MDRGSYGRGRQCDRAERAAAHLPLLPALSYERPWRDPAHAGIPPGGGGKGAGMGVKHILLIATGGTIASKHTEQGLSPQISGKELLAYIPEAKDFCRIDVVQPFSLDSTNVYWKQWLTLAELIHIHYDRYDGFVICHGTDTMAYTAAALSYLVQHSSRRRSRSTCRIPTRERT